ncbi:GreA/GreB family elongation factor [Variovorax sp. J22R115]|uniref:GreA/GreB family elongation factor n=1 Tax=Variovorax sp. J22R115 TaxID=3053509 RepID=UPI0025766063|nr:GreA/GreB family elongation factor [Variovorax sp. J22R115]MDM0047577.1 GreA/GreB family elongation factor [Variovorax sp. J22R115]
MHAVVHGERTLTELDFTRLTKLGPVSSTLSDLLATADVTSGRAVSADVVTMYSRVELVDVATHRRQMLTICYPGDAEPAAGFVSVLSPVGNGLLGLKTGDVARWHTPNGDEYTAEIAAIQYQPEATGDYSK